MLRLADIYIFICLIFYFWKKSPYIMELTILLQNAETILLQQTENWNIATHSWSQMCWFVYWLNCTSLCAVWCLKKATGTRSLTQHNDERSEVWRRSKLIKSDVSIRRTFHCNLIIYAYTGCYSQTGLKHSNDVMWLYLQPTQSESLE